MSLATRTSLSPCRAGWTATCSRAFSGSSSSQAAAAQAKQKPQVQQNWGRDNSISGNAYGRGGPSNLYPPLRIPKESAQGNSNTRWRPQAQTRDRSGANSVGTPDRGWGPRQPLPPQRSNVLFGAQSSNGNVRGNVGERASRSPFESRQMPPKLPIGRDKVDPLIKPVANGMEDAYEDSSVASAWAERSGEIRSSGGNRIHPHAEKEQRRREEERHRELRIGKEQQIHRDKTARQVMKGVAKLVELQASRDVYLSKHVSVEQLSKAFGVRLERLQAALRKAGLEEVSYDHLLDSEDAALIAPEFGCNVVIDEAAAFDIYPPPLPADLSTLPHRPPVVTIMGHVDHGKTTLLDTLRSASVAQGEAGGITQHIGAFSLPVSSLSTSKKAGNKDERMITFLDTPGHAAFSAMRARGAMVTDVIILVVAADDGVMPQTKEVINLVKKEQGRVGLVVAINKIDKPGADPMTVKQMLLAEGVQLEEFGGDVPAVEVSGLTGQGLDTLMETTSLVSELMDIRAEQKGTSVGYVLESKIVKGFGPVATVLLLRGEMNAGSHLIAGQTQCRVRTLTDSNGKTMKKVTPGTAVSIAGWKELPNAGDEVIEASENDIKRAITNRKRNAEMASLVEDVSAINEKRRLEREKREQELEAAKEALESGKTLPIKPVDRPEMETSEEGPEVLRLIIKADVSGSAEAVAGALEGIGNDKATTKIIQYGVGNVTESDITMAKATGASIIAFGVQCPRTITQLALSQHVPVIASDIIYRLMETVREKVAGLLPPIIEHKVTGEANVQQMFEIDLKGRKTLKVAGCRVVNGTLEKNKSMRLVRNGEIIHDGTLETFRHLKKDITEARKGMECGLSLSKFTGDFLPGDAIQMYETITKPAIL